MIKSMLFAGAGGFIGTCLRFLTNKFCATFWNNPFPLATFIVNIAGCFLLGLLIGWLRRAGLVTSDLNAFFVVGLCGGLTTFSTFSLEILSLGNLSQWIPMALYIALSIIVGLILMQTGIFITGE